MRMPGPRNQSGWLTAAALRAGYTEQRANVKHARLTKSVTLSWRDDLRLFQVLTEAKRHDVLIWARVEHHITLTEARVAFTKAGKKI